MSIPPSTPVNKYFMHKRVEDVEKLAANCDTVIRELTARFDRQPPQGERGATGPAGLSIKGDAGRDGKDGKEGVGYPGANGLHGTNGHDGKDGAPGQDSAAVLASTRAELETVRREFADLKLVVDAIYQQNKQTAGYIQYLREKRAKQ
jgi:hypothetical protein